MDSSGDESEGVTRFAREVGLGVSTRTIQRVVKGEVSPAAPILGRVEEGAERKRRSRNSEDRDEPTLALGPEEVREISAILSRSAGASYLGIGDLEVSARAGEIVLRARVFEPEEEYE